MYKKFSSYTTENIFGFHYKDQPVKMV